MTRAELREVTRKIDSLLVSADCLAELYRKMNVLESNSSGGWQTLRSPQWIGDKLVAVLIRPERP